MDKIKKPWGIRGQLIAGITLVTVAAIALLGFLSIKMLEWSALFRKAKEAEVIAAVVQTFVQDMPPIEYIGDRQGAEAKGFRDFVKSIMEKGIIRDMGITDEKGRVFFVTGKGVPTDKDDGRLLFSVKGLAVKMTGGGWFEGVGKELFISTSVKQGSGAAGLGLGRLVFSMPLSDIKEEGANFRRFILFYALFDSLIIITFGIYLFSRGIIRPMALLKETAESIAGGRLEQRVNIKASNEIGGFASSFNIMADKLEEKIKTLERLNKELTAMQGELIRSEKLATVGRLAAGIAHEIGNPLGAILGYVDILKKQESEVRGLPPSVSIGGQGSEEILIRLEKEILRIDSIVRGLLDFSRPSIPLSGTKKAAHNIDINRTVEDSVEILLPQFSANGISFDLKLDKDMPNVLMDDGKLKQVLLNIFINAKDAMPEGGKISVKTVVSGQWAVGRRRKNDIADADIAGIRTQTLDRSYVIISITDTGRGIREEDIGKIFDPFFTTKEQEKGTGLGLSVSLGIIEAYGGNIKVKSKEGEGATFEVFLPI